jgi:hypothetical protein
MSFANLKVPFYGHLKTRLCRTRGIGTETTTNKYEDDRKWKPTVDDKVMVML